MINKENNYTHIYQTSSMYNYLPEEYNKYKPYTTRNYKSFLHYLSSKEFCYYSDYFNDKRRNEIMKLINTARKISIYDLKQELIYNQISWYCKKIIELMKYNLEEDEKIFCQLNINYSSKDYRKYDGKYKEELKIEIYERNKKHYNFELEYKDFDKFISEPNYLKRNYSDKLKAYSYNLLELYLKYFNKDNFHTNDYIDFNATIWSEHSCYNSGIVQFNEYW